MTISSIEVEEVLAFYSNADIFNSIIYATNIDWVEEFSLIKDVQVGEIKTKMKWIQVLTKQMCFSINFIEH